MPGGQSRRFVGCERDQVRAELSTANLVQDGRFGAAMKLSGNKACALSKHAISLIPVAACRTGSERRAGAIVSETRPPRQLCQWTSRPNRLRFFLRGVLRTLELTQSVGEAAGDVTSLDVAPPVPDYTYLDRGVAAWSYEVQAALAALNNDVLRAVQASTVHVSVLYAGSEGRV